MARFGDEDRDTFLDDMGLPVKYGSKCTKGHLDEEEETETDGNGASVLVVRTVLEVNSAEFEKGGKLYGLTANSTNKTLIVDGTTYTVHDKRFKTDGAFTIIYMAKA